MAEDDLNSFFSEINQLDEAVEITSSSKNTEVVISKPAEVISKPADIRTSHAVYTYEFPVGSYTSSATQIDIQSDAFSAPSSSSYAAGYAVPPPQPSLATPYVSGSSSAAPPLPPVPFVPRQNKKFVRSAAGEVWVDDSLNEWPENDYRIFVGDLAKEVTTETLTRHFQHYTSFAKAKVIRSKQDNKTKGYGFVSFLDPMDCAKAIREQNGKYLASRPMKIMKGNWKERDLKEVKKKEQKKRKLQESLGL